jgi:hypothetical protein
MYQPVASQPASVDPIIARLRPRTVAEILDQAFRLYRRHFLTFLAIIAVVHIPLQLIIQFSTASMLGGIQDFATDFETGSSPSSTQMNELFTYAGVIYGVLIITSILYSLLLELSRGALTGAIANSHLDKPVSFGDAYRQMLSRIGPLIGSIFLQLAIGIAVFVPVVLLMILSVFAGLANDNDGAFFGLFCFSFLLFIPAFVLFAYVFVRMVAITPAIMVERLGPVQALRRSWDLVKGYWWRTFALIVILSILGYIVQLGPAYLITLIATLISPEDFVTQQLVSGAVTILTSLIYIPIQLTATTLYYFDLRVRKEGFDLDAALSQRYTTPPPPPTPAYDYEGSYGATYGAGYGGNYGGYGTQAVTQPQPPPPAEMHTHPQPNPYVPPDVQPWNNTQPTESPAYGQEYGTGTPTQPSAEPPSSARTAPITGPLAAEDGYNPETAPRSPAEPPVLGGNTSPTPDWLSRPETPGRETPDDKGE